MVLFDIVFRYQFSYLNFQGDFMDKKSYTIEFKNISLVFDNKEILKNFNLNIKRGEKILISSPSGSGKTSLLRLLMGFNLASSGEIFVEGIKLQEDTVDKIREKIGYLSQKMSFRNLKISQLIEEILSYKRNSKIEFNMEKIQEFLTFLKLENKVLNQEINDLSGGEKQRIGFLISLLLDRDIWIFDEITSSLDKELKEKIVEYINSTEKTVIMISHDKIEALDKFKKVVL